MDIKSTVNGNRMEMKLSGKLDTVSVPDFEEKTQTLPKGITEVVLDMSELLYVSSAGLRAILVLLQDLEEADGTLYVRNVPQIVQDVFEVTGFDLLLQKL